MASPALGVPMLLPTTTSWTHWWESSPAGHQQSHRQEAAALGLGRGVMPAGWPLSVLDWVFTAAHWVSPHSLTNFGASCVHLFRLTPSLFQNSLCHSLVTTYSSWWWLSSLAWSVEVWWLFPPAARSVWGKCFLRQFWVSHSRMVFTLTFQS